jgi:PAP2 superfamily
LGTIDPDVAIEAVAAGPQSGDFAVPPLVRRQRRVEERDAQRDREQDDRERRWGPPAGDVSRRTMIGAYAALSAVLAVAVWQLGLGLTPERYLLVLLVPALILRQVKAYLVDFVPFALLLVFYSTCRGLAHMVNPTPFYTPQLEAERLLFGGQLPTTELQHLLGWSRAGVNARIAVEATQLHFIVPPLLGFVLWTRRRALFYRFAATMLVLSFAGAIAFLAYPAAPPWAAGHAHMANVVHLTHAREAISAGTSGVANDSIAKLIPKNPYASIPSLHAGYAFLVFLFVATLAWRSPRRRWIVPIAALYPILECTAVVYTGDHYVVDTIIGALFATGSFVAVRRFWRARGWPA